MESLLSGAVNASIEMIAALVALGTLLVLYFRYRVALAKVEDERRQREFMTQLERETLAELRASVEREAVILQNIDEIVYRMHPEGNGWVTDFVSPRVAEVLGYTPDQMISLGSSSIHPEDLPHLLEQVAETSHGGSTTTARHRFRHQNGTYRWFENRLRAVPASAYGGPLIFGVARDISERLDADDALRLSQEELQQALKMEALGRLAGGIAHDFNNLLTTIGGNAGLVVEQMSADDPIREPLKDILAASARAAQFTRQLLAFSRKQVLQSKPLELGDVVAGMQTMLSRLIGPEYRLEPVADNDVPTIEADRGQVEQVLMNLVVNARDAMPGGGTIAVHTRASGEQDVATLRRLGGQRALYAVIEVQDTGTGISDEVRERIFEPFFTTKELGKGTGLGLAMVYGFVRQSGGEIDVISDGHRGTCFRIYLPAIGAAPIERPATTVHEARSDGPFTVLVVDDEPGVRHLASSMLRLAGYEVVEAGDGEEAQEIAEHNGRIDVLLTDVVMPGTRGPELAARLRATRPRMRVIYMSGFRDTAPLADVERGDAVFLEKPFLRAALLGALNRVAPIT